jgi:hypothetical protein
MKPLSSHQEMYESLLILKSNHFSSSSWDALGFRGCQNVFHITSFEIDYGLSIENLNFLSTRFFLFYIKEKHITPLNRGFTYLNLGGRCPCQMGVTILDFLMVGFKGCLIATGTMRKCCHKRCF